MSNNKVLIVELHRRFGGGQAYSLSLHKTLLANGYESNILVPKGKEITEMLEAQNIPCVKTNILRLGFIKPIYQIALAIKLYLVCKKNKINVIHCNKDIELWSAKLVVKLLNLRVVFTRHVLKPLKKLKRIKDIAGIVCVNPDVAKNIENLNKNLSLNIKTIAFIPPFFDEEKFIKHKSIQSKDDFFKQNFNIELKKCPVISVIANLSVAKNQQVLLHAMAKLINEKHKFVQAVLAGAGSQRSFYERLAEKLGITEYVHFLGFTDKTADVLFHSDMMVLSSKLEGFGIVLMEAALMKKPIISTFGSGPEYVVKHGHTGLLFNWNDASTLTEQIQLLIESPEYGKKLSENAYNFVIQNLSNQAKFEKMDLVYKSLF